MFTGHQQTESLIIQHRSLADSRPLTHNYPFLEQDVSEEGEATEKARLSGQIEEADELNPALMASQVSSGMQTGGKKTLTRERRGDILHFSLEE